MSNRLLAILLLGLPFSPLAAGGERTATSLSCQMQWAQKDGKRIAVKQRKPIPMQESGDLLHVGDVRYVQTLTRANRRYFSSDDRLLHACVIDEGHGQRKVILRISGTATAMVMRCNPLIVSADNP